MLRVQGLEASYGESLALQGVDLSVEIGEIKALMGRNGMGKSTLLKAIMGLVKIRRGEVAVEGRSVTGMPTFQIALEGVGYVPQGREIFASFSVLENLRVGLLRFPRAERVIPKEIYDYFPLLKERENQRAGSFSGGQQQMLAIARALVGRPKLLLLDEPSEGIQPSIVEEIAEILKKINQETGLTILVVEQNINMISDIADSCAFMEKGRIAYACAMEEIMRDESIITRYMSV